MIARSRICLRCQLRLARHSVPSKIQIARLSTKAKERIIVLGKDGDEAAEAKPSIRRVLAEELKFENGAIQRLPIKNGQISEYPLGKLYGFRGKMQRENRESLGDVSVLGDPAEVIVLRDSDVNKYTASLREIEAVESESIDIYAALNEERGLPGEAEVTENINNFRPKKGHEPRTIRELNDIVQEMQAAFTVSQLERYMRSFEDVPTVEATRKQTKRGFIRVSPWVPAVSEDMKPISEDSIRGYSLASYTSKHRLALRLVLDCWKLQLPELEEGVGEVEVSLHQAEYDALFSETNSVLSQISANHIPLEDESFEGIDGIPERSTVRITTTRARSELIIDELEQELKTYRRLELLAWHVAPWSLVDKKKKQKWLASTFDDALLESLGDLTKTKVQKVIIPEQQGAAKKLVISSIGQQANPLASDKVDVALRLLLQSANLPGRITQLLGCKDSGNATDGAFIKHPVTGAFSWWERLRVWSRWVTPIGKEASEPDTVPGASRTSQKGCTNSKLELPNVRTLKLSSLEEEESNGEAWAIQPQSENISVNWGSKYRTDSSTLLGTILHSARTHEATLPSELTEDLPSRAVQKFDSTIPNLSKILSSLDPTEMSGPVETLVLHFMPNPVRQPKPLGPRVLSAFPSVEMIFTVHPETKESSLRHMRALVSRDNSDVMLPASSVDVRFQQDVWTVFDTEKGEYPKSILDFIQNSNLSLYAKSKLETPSKLMIPIDAHLCSGPGFEVLGPAKARTTSQQVEYLFAGLEIRNTLTMKFDDWLMSYTSIESGRANGRRSELRLRPTIMTESADVTNSEDKVTTSEDKFTQSVFRLIDALDTGIMPAPLTKYTTDREKNMVRHIKSYDPHQQRRLAPDGKVRYFARRPDIRKRLLQFREEEEQKRQEEYDEVWEILEGVRSVKAEDELIEEIKVAMMESEMAKQEAGKARKEARAAEWGPGKKPKDEAQRQAHRKYCDEHKLCYVCLSPGHNAPQCPLGTKNQMRREHHEAIRAAKDMSIPLKTVLKKISSLDIPGKKK